MKGKYITKNLTDISKGDCGTDPSTLISLFIQDLSETNNLKIAISPESSWTHKVVIYTQEAIRFKTSDHYLAKALGIIKDTEYIAETLPKPYKDSN